MAGDPVTLSTATRAEDAAERIVAYQAEGTSCGRLRSDKGASWRVRCVAIKADPAPPGQRFLAQRDAESALHELSGRLHEELDDLRDRELERKARIDHVAPQRMGPASRDEGLHRDVERDDPPVLSDDYSGRRAGVKQHDSRLRAARLRQGGVTFVRPFRGRGSQRRREVLRIGFPIDDGENQIQFRLYEAAFSRNPRRRVEPKAALRRGDTRN
jgi:hypothetical protein